MAGCPSAGELQLARATVLAEVFAGTAAVTEVADGGVHRSCRHRVDALDRDPGSGASARMGQTAALANVAL